MGAQAIFARGWARFPVDPGIAAWASAARPVADKVAADPLVQEAWLRCDGTWFAGVNVFPNDAAGAVAVEGVPPLSGAPVAFIREALGLDKIIWDNAQISVGYPGYPRPWDGESAAAFRYRRDRDAAHVDGLMRDGPARRRKLGERHAFILGLPLTEVGEGAAPLVVWEGSHEVMRVALGQALADVSPGDWGEVDVTEAYHSARRRCFETLKRVEIAAQPGEAYLVHRLALHGVAPWRAEDDRARSVAYFRPGAPGEDDSDWWLRAP